MTRAVRLPTSVIYPAGRAPQIVYACTELAVVEGPDTGLAVRVDKPVVLGTHRGAQLKLTDRSVSRQHAEVRPSGNGLWLRDLGSMIEARKTSWLLLVMILVLAGTSNVAQYMVSGPNFGGMSGVVYGLLGYVWMQGRFNPASKLSLHPQTVTFMIVWFFLCLFGLVGHVANTAHAVGLGVGVAWGFLGAQLRASLRRG